MASALVLGATGMTGRKLVAELLASPHIAKVQVVGRRKAGENERQAWPNQEKLVETIVNFDKLDEAKDAFAGHDVGYCCLGTTRADAGSAEAFVKIDYAIPLQAAKMFKENGKGDQHYMLVTASGSNASSMFLYPRTKGELERDVQALGFSRLTILRPGLLDYRPDPRPSRRAWEEYAAPVVSFLAPRSGIIGVGLLGRAMRLLTEDWLAARAGGRTASEAGVRVLENAAILDVAERK